MSLRNVRPLRAVLIALEKLLAGLTAHYGQFALGALAGYLTARLLP